MFASLVASLRMCGCDAYGLSFSSTHSAHPMFAAAYHRAIYGAMFTYTFTTYWHSFLLSRSFFPSTSAISCYEIMAEKARMNGTRKCENAYRYCIITTKANALWSTSSFLLMPFAFILEKGNLPFAFFFFFAKIAKNHCWLCALSQS